jgi:glycosyltransferase involved in cell wall biosynthesis
MTPKVSIVTTVYDRVFCLRRCLRAMAHSAWTDYEQIVVSDAPPTDVQRQIDAAVAAAGPRVRHIALTQRTNNWGIGPAEAGLRASVGEYVCFLSDDNAYLPDHFGPLVAALDADPGLAFAYSSCLYAGRKVLRYAPPQGARIDLGQPLFRRAVLRDQLHDSINFNEFAWDWCVIATLLTNGCRWQHVDAASFVFRLDAYPALVEALA